MLAAAGAIIPRTFGAESSKAEPVSGMNYAPQGKPQPVVKPGEFVFGAAHFDHGHIYGMCSALIDAGATLKSFYEPDEKKQKAFQEKFPQAKLVTSLDAILADPEIKLVAAAAVSS